MEGMKKRTAQKAVRFLWESTAEGLMQPQGLPLRPQLQYYLKILDREVFVYSAYTETV